MSEQKPIGVGIEQYKRMIDKSYYYIDKTYFIKDLLDKGGAVNLFTRPRRFGKTLVLSMLKTYFECETDIYGTVKDNRHYFDGMKISELGQQYTDVMGKYPVISLSLKSAKQPDYDMAYKSILYEVAKEYERHRYVLLGNALSQSARERYVRIMNQAAEPVEYARGLAFLSECLTAYHGKNTIILLDEYDVPLENAHFEGFYEQMVKFIRSLLESALKTNECLEFAVITGCLRISRESIFTGLNNLEINSVLTADYAEHFGFTIPEVEQMLHDYGLEEKKEEVRNWYDGYLFGNTEVCNPWSVMNYVKRAVSDRQAFPRPYWSNTSSNSIIRELVERADTSARKMIEELIADGTVEVEVHEDITYEDVYRTQENLWNFLFFTGYLKKISERFEQGNIYITMTIPNWEVRMIYRKTILEWFEQKLKVTDFTGFYEAILDGNTEIMENVIKRQLQRSISYHDNAELFYHGFMLGILGALQDYEIQSNQERGNGRPDIQLIPLDEKKPAIIMELKRVQKFTQMEAGCEEALAQTERQSYHTGLLEEGYLNIRDYGICFCKKSCMVQTKCYTQK